MSNQKDKTMLEKEKRNESYKERFQILLTVNGNVICQRYFKVNNYVPGSTRSLEFNNTMRYIVDIIKNELVRKSRIYEWYTANSPVKLTGFKPGEDDVWIEIPESDEAKYDEEENLKPYDVTFKFSFMIDEKPVFEEIWDGTQYPKYVRNSVDLSNAKPKFNDLLNMNFKQSMWYRMTVGEPDYIYIIIKEIYGVISEHKEKNKYTKSEVYRNGDEDPKEYRLDYFSKSFVDGWRDATRKKTDIYLRENGILRS